MLKTCIQLTSQTILIYSTPNIYTYTTETNVYMYIYTHTYTYTHTRIWGMANIAYYVIFKHWTIGTLFSKQIVWCEHTCLLCSPTCQYPGSISSGFPGPPLKIIKPHKVVKNMNSVIIIGKSSEGTGLELRLILDSVTEACFLIHNVEQWQFSARAAVTTGTGHSCSWWLQEPSINFFVCHLFSVQQTNVQIARLLETGVLISLLFNFSLKVDDLFILSPNQALVSWASMTLL